MKGRQQRRTMAGTICTPQGILNDAVEFMKEVPYEI
jgi:hypothetical protein